MHQHGSRHRCWPMTADPSLTLHAYVSSSRPRPWPSEHADRISPMHRATFVAAGGISALVHSLQEGSSRAKAAAVELLLGFAMDGVDNQEWIGAAPGAIPSLVDMLRSGSLLQSKCCTDIQSLRACQLRVCGLTPLQPLAWPA